MRNRPPRVIDRRRDVAQLSAAIRHPPPAVPTITALRPTGIAVSM
jgi:hypothetical protein